MIQAISGWIDRLGAREVGGVIGFQGWGGILNQDFFLVGERPLWVDSGPTINAIERPLFHTNYYDNWATRSSSWIWVGGPYFV